MGASGGTYRRPRFSLGIEVAKGEWRYKLVTSKWGVIFDMDGVLVDSYQAHFASWQMMCRENGLQISREQFEATFGRTSREVIRFLWGEDLSDADVARWDARKEALFRKLCNQNFPVMEGAVELMDALYAAGCLLALGSSAPPENVEQALDGLQRRACFRGVITGADVKRGKPDPQVFLLAAERLNLPPSRCIVIEDAPAGIAAAHAAGTACVGLVSTGRTRAELSKADWVVDHLSELDVDSLQQLLPARHLS